MIDLPLHGRKFTWYRPNGRCKSRLDRFLVNTEWLSNWPHSIHKGLPRSVSDHCPIPLDTKIIDWGPRPFRFVKAWTTHPGFKEFVDNTWKSAEVVGWGGFVVKEKMKFLKGELKKWNKSVFGTIEENIESLRGEIQELDVIDDIFRLEELEVICRKEITADLFRNLNGKHSLAAQKAKVKW